MIPAWPAAVLLAAGAALILVGRALATRVHMCGDTTCTEDHQ